MIQRLQTIFLFVTALLDLFFFFTPLYSQAMADPVEWIGYGLAISLTIAMVTAAVSIFLYGNRALQLKVVKTGTYIQIIALGFGTGVLFSLGGFGIFLWQETLGLLLVVIALVMFWLAGRNIKKDDDLVKSMDRIR